MPPPKNVSGDPSTNSTGVVEQPYLKSTVSRFGGTVWQGATVSLPQKAFDIQAAAPTQVDHSNFETRYQPNLTTFGAGVPGYTGFKPHGTTTLNVDAHAYISGVHDPSLQPYVMPPPGYSGHLRSASRGDANNGWGTSHWKPATNKPGVASPTKSPPKYAGPPMSPEQEAEIREAAEANELLDLRSMGIRAALRAAPDSGGGAFSF